jgi:hypothetical protein
MLSIIKQIHKNIIMSIQKIEKILSKETIKLVSQNI